MANKNKTHYRSVFISDTHLGMKGILSRDLADFLNSIKCENLYLVGDIIDGVLLKRKWFFPQDHARVIHILMKLSHKGTRIRYIPGNHDIFMRDMLTDMGQDINLGNIEIKKEHVHETVNGKKYLITHGDQFDMLVKSKILMTIGSIGYEKLIWLNKVFNRIRASFGLKYWSLASYAKRKTKKAMVHISNFENGLATLAKDNGYDGVVCGHIHLPEIKDIDGVKYINTGDWVENATAVVETESGDFIIIRKSIDQYK